MASFPNVNAANKYARDVVSGKILTCKLTIQACKRHLDDLEKSKSDRFPYRFDKNKAERVCRFIQKLCHTKDEWAKKPLDQARIKLEPWQLFIYCSVFGWLKKSDGLRRYREVYIEVPRKNGKSILAAGTGLYMLCADGEYGAEVYCGAPTEADAKKVFDPAKRMCERITNIRKKFNIAVWAKKLVRTDGSVFEPIIGNPNDGASPSCGIVDEYHQHPTNDQYSCLQTGMGSRSQPLMWTITTAGTSLESPCYDMHERVCEMLDGITDDPTLFGIIYSLDEGDDWKSIESIKKANPNYGISVKEDYLVNQIGIAVNRKRLTNIIKTKNLNIWVNAQSAFFNLETWKRCKDSTLTIESFISEECFVGMDLARKLDINAAVKVFVRMIDGKRHYYCINPRFYVPYDTVFNNEDARTGERYQKFLNQEVLTVTDGAEIDYRYILEDAIADNELTPILETPIDPHGATNLSHHLDDEQLTPITIQQNYTNMSDPMKELEAAIENGRFHHDGNPLMTWMISNVIGKSPPGSDDIVRPIKENSRSKIDGAVALIMAIGRAMNSDGGKSIYDTRGMIIL